MSEKADVVATARTGPDALQAIKDLKPAIAILDLSMPEMNGIEVTRQALHCHPEAAIIICSVHCEPALIQAAAAAGASGYVHKPCMRTELVPAIEAVALGERIFPSAVLASPRHTSDG